MFSPLPPRVRPLARTWDGSYRDQRLFSWQISRPHTEWVRSGAGYFTSKFSISEESIKYISPVVLESIKSIAVNSGKAFTIADYGCADGGTSMPLMYACVKELRSLHGNELEVHINYEDRPENDYNSIFYFLQGKEKGFVKLLNCN